MSDLRLTACTVDLTTGRVSPSGEVLAPRELELLRYLAERPGEPLDRNQIQRGAFGYAATIHSRAVDQAMFTLRRRLERDPTAPDHLETVPRVGYRFVPLREEPARALTGRAAEIAELERRLLEPGWVTLAGPGGVGKSTLAEHVARGWRGEVASCALEAVGSEHELSAAIAAALGVVQPPAPTPTALGVAAGARGDLLLVLDGFEHLVAHVGAVVALRRHAPNLRVLVTSRTFTGAPGERVLQISPLGTDDATRLLVERARALGVDAEPAALAPLAAQLDGLPLLLELVAPWLLVLGPDEILARLASPLSLPEGGGERVRQVVARTSALLDDVERDVATALSVFRRPFPTGAAEAALGDRAGDRATVDVLASLVRKSVLLRSTVGGRVLLTMLGSVRAWFAEQLGAEPDRERRVVEAHLRAIVARHPGVDPTLGADRVELGAAVRDAVRLGLYEAALAGLDRLVFATEGITSAGLADLQGDLLDAPSLPPELRGRLHLLAAHVWMWEKRHAQSLAAADAALVLLPEPDHPRVWLVQAFGHVGLDDLDGAVALRDRLAATPGAHLEDARWFDLEQHLAQERATLGEALDHARAALHAALRSGAVADQRRTTLGVLLSGQGDVEGARREFEAAMAAVRALGPDAKPLRVPYCLANLAILDEDEARKEPAFRELIVQLERHGRIASSVVWRLGLAEVLGNLGRMDEARRELDDVHAVVQAHDLHRLGGRAHRVAGELALLAEQPDVAVRELSQAAVLLPRGERIELIRAQCALALALVQLGRGAEARAALAQAEASAEPLGLWPTARLARRLERVRQRLRDAQTGP